MNLQERAKSKPAGMSFGSIVDAMKRCLSDTTVSARRAEWPSGRRIKISAEGLITVSDDNGEPIEWQPLQRDILADDWTAMWASWT